MIKSPSACRAQQLKSAVRAPPWSEPVGDGANVRCRASSVSAAHVGVVARWLLVVEARQRRRDEGGERELRRKEEERREGSGRAFLEIWPPTFS